MSLTCRARNRSGESTAHSHSTKQIPYSAAAAAAAMSSEDVVRFHFASHEVSILRRMNQLRLEERFCDVTIVAERLRFPGHRVVLAACSPFLRDQFHMNPSREVQVFPMTGAQAVQRLLLSCYTGTLEFPFRDILDYLTAASCLQMEHVVEKCRQSLSPRIGPRLPLPPTTGPDERERPATPQIASSSERDGPWGEAGEAVKLERELGGQQPQPRPRPRPLGSVGGGGGGGFGAPDQLRIRKVESLADCMAAEGSGLGPEPDPRIHSTVGSGGDGSGCHDDYPEAGTSGGPVGGAGPPYDMSEVLITGDFAEEDYESSASEDCRSGLYREEPGLAGSTQPGGSVTDEAAVAARCSECGADFEQREHLAAHMVTHRLYMCLLCGKVFKKNARLAQHINVHTGFKPYCCAVCGRTFTQKRSLKDHMNVHNGDAPHCCSYCDMRFTHYSTLRVHLRDQHGTTTTRNLDNKPTVISMVVP
ncbi:zinc finger and BTB domain-containing protein 26-like [Amblyraja radiata]|uniref:zinc finger and BTB domain-containing protein 26-like n=1 Tax=Amblyraja radiata TaxID=386614 RepID=UPI001403A2D9|nr:zinc finger and BTB domain-containing protein 26-like [Amblyraja radiata]XP_032903496.1 zinc finger and BTB domain-containing protein 26-like [Amblyraja radiata]